MSSPNLQIYAELLRNSPPDTCTIVPPQAGARDGSNPVTVKSSEYSNCDLPTNSIPLLLTSTATLPVVLRGVSQRSSVDELTAASLSVPPTLHATCPDSAKCFPVTLSTVPPLARPPSGHVCSKIALSMNSNGSASTIVTSLNTSSSCTTPGCDRMGVWHMR
eukprot:3934403-Rhodomonas_salina.1